MEILTAEKYSEVETFVSNHPNGSFMQSPSWAKVKPNWKQEIVVVRDEQGSIKASMSILIMPMGPSALMYAPRGPVCDYNDIETLKNIISGAKEVGKKHHAHILKLDPYILEGDEEHIENLKSIGLDFTANAAFKDTIQPRYNYMLPYIKGMSKEDLIAGFVRETRYYIRYAPKQGVDLEWNVLTISIKFIAIQEQDKALQQDLKVILKAF